MASHLLMAEGAGAKFGFTPAGWIAGLAWEHERAVAALVLGGAKVKAFFRFRRALRAPRPEPADGREEAVSDEAARAHADFVQRALDTPRRSRLAQTQDQDTDRGNPVDDKAARLADLIEHDVTLASWEDFKAWRAELQEPDPQ